MRKKFLFCLAAVLIQIKNVVCVSTGDNARDFLMMRALHRSRSKHLNRLLYDANLLHCNLCLYSCDDVSVACNILIHRFFPSLATREMSCWCFFTFYELYVDLCMCVFFFIKPSLEYFLIVFTCFSMFFHLLKSNFLDSIT